MHTTLQASAGPASLIPFGIGSGLPGPVGPVVRALRDNSHDLSTAVEVLRHTPCVACAIAGFHFCTARLPDLASLNSDAVIPFDIARVDSTDSQALLGLGRITRPFVRRRRGFEPISWDEALRMAAPRDDGTWVVAAAGLTDETLYAVHRAASLLGHTAHLPMSTPAFDLLRFQRASTEDLTEAELVLIWGDAVLDASPHLLQDLARAKDRGARVVWLHHTYDRRMEADRSFASLRSLVFGSRALDAWFPAADLEAVATMLRDPSHGRPLRAASGLHEGQLDEIRSDLASSNRTVSVLSPQADRPTIEAIHALHGHHAWEGVGSGLLPVPAGSGVCAARGIGIAAGPAPVATWQCVVGDAPPVDSEVRVHLDSHLRPAMWAPAKTTLVLPLQPLQAQLGGGWLTTADGRIVAFEPALIPGARPGWRLPLQLMAAARPELAGELPSTIDVVRDALRQLPSHANTTALAPGGWTRIPRTC